MRTNAKPAFTEKTHEGATAARMTDAQALRRSVLSCLLFESEFYEDGEEIASRIVSLALKRPASEVAALAVEARSQFNLRHVPLLLLSVIAQTGAGTSLVADAIAATIQRADEMAEFLSIHAKRNGVTPDKLKGKISAQMKKGLAKAFGRFDEYALAKYDRAGAVRMRDALFLCHAKPADDAQADLWSRLVKNELVIPDTWEVALSGGADKKATFERLIVDGKLGYLALLRNLRNMVEAGVDPALVKAAILERKGARRVLPFRYVAAARHAPMYERELDNALVASIAEMKPLSGVTAIMVDVSGSMDERLSAKSDLSRKDAAATLAAIFPGDVRLFSFADAVMELPPRKGMAGVDAITRSQSGGTRLFDAMMVVNNEVKYDRIVVITDEQAFGPARGGRYGMLGTCPEPRGKGYMINVASAKNGVGYGPWVHIDGFSEQVIRFIAEHERAAA